MVGLASQNHRLNLAFFCLEISVECEECGESVAIPKQWYDDLPDFLICSTCAAARNHEYRLKRPGDKQATNSGSHDTRRRDNGTLTPARNGGSGLDSKQLLMIPARVALALQADGWWLRSDIIWAKPNPMPESVTDRPTRSHEYIFLLAKSERYFYDADAIREPATKTGTPGHLKAGSGNGRYDGYSGCAGKSYDSDAGRNKRDVWTINSEPTPEAHFATFPTKLVEPCILAGTSEKGCCAECGAPRVRVTGDPYPVEGRGAGNGFKREERQTYRDKNGARGDETIWTPKGRDTIGWQPSCTHDAPSAPGLVLDPFLGSGTVGRVAERFGRRWVGLELSAEYIGIAEERTAQMGFVL